MSLLEDTKAVHFSMSLLEDTKAVHFSMSLLEDTKAVHFLMSLLDTKAVHFSILLSALWMKKSLLLAWIEFWLTVQPLGHQQPHSEGNFCTQLLQWF